MSKTVFRPIIWLFLLFPVVVLGQKETKYTISGYIKDSLNGESLMQSTLFVEELKTGVAANEYGFYSITLPKGNYTIRVQYIGYAPIYRKILLDNNVTMNFEMVSSAQITKEVVVTGQKADQNVKNTQVGRQEITIETAKVIPALLGEVDVLKSIQLLPGVMAAGEGNTGFYVRGGGPDQNLVLLDDATVYNTGHLFGFFSVFNSDAVKGISIEKGAMPAEYGGRISSVVDVKMKEGNMKSWQAEGGIGLIASRLTVQGPLWKNRCSMILSGRRTYIDILTKPLLKNVANGAFAGNAYYFYDINAKVNFRFSDRDRVFLSGYFGRDVFKFKDNTGTFGLDFPWGNTTFTARWNHLFSEKLFANTEVMYNDYQFKANVSYLSVKFNVHSSIKEVTAKTVFDFFPAVNHKVKFGAQYQYRIFTPYTASGSADTTNFANENSYKKYGHETAIFIQDEIDFNDKIRVNFGIRASMFNLVGPFKKVEFSETGIALDTLEFAKGKNIKTYFGIEPRISSRFQVAKNTSIKAGLSVTNQYVHLVSSSVTTLPLDIWVPSSLKIKPQIGAQVSLGVYQNFLDNMLETYIEGYYKHMWNQIEYSETSVSNINVDLEDQFTFGRGWSYGAEFFIKKAKGKFTGWIGYTLAWTQRKFPHLNNGETFSAKYDRRHDLSVVLMYDINKRWNVSSTFVFASGNTTTLPQELYFANNGEIHFIYGKRNAYRLPPYHRLDIGATYRFKPRKHMSHDINFSIYNVYSRQNPYFVYVNITNGSQSKGKVEAKLMQMSLFPILPSITWNFKFY